MERIIIWIRTQRVVVGCRACTGTSTLAEVLSGIVDRALSFLASTQRNDETATADDLVFAPLPPPPPRSSTVRPSDDDHDNLHTYPTQKSLCSIPPTYIYSYGIDLCPHIMGTVHTRLVTTCFSLIRRQMTFSSPLSDFTLQYGLRRRRFCLQSSGMYNVINGRHAF